MSIKFIMHLAAAVCFFLALIGVGTTAISLPMLGFFLWCTSGLL